jgi:sterol desaturase/sphingolipid hydroxylase (fatty acid hydroxylase superfamily)
VIAHIPILRDDPFVHIVFGVFSKANSYNYFQYLSTVAIMAPGGYVAACLLISILSGEWSERRPAAIAQMKEATIHLVMSAPFMAYMFKKFIEGSWGELYHEEDNEKHSLFYSIVVTPICYWIITDASFYWQHRLFHSEWLYSNFHSFHHKCRPITTFCGNSAGLLELVVVEFCHALMPPLFLPIRAKSWIFLALGNQVFTIYLHTFDDCGISRLPVNHNLSNLNKTNNQLTRN